MRPLPLAAVLVSTALGLAGPIAAQSPTRDWRPQDRTIVGDFTQITSLASTQDRVYVTSPTALLVWSPQFQEWSGPFDPPDPAFLARVNGALGDPLDNSLWLSRADGWTHYQADLDLWDAGRIPDGVVTIAFDADDPGVGLYIRTRRGWQLLPRGGFSASPSRAPARPVTPTSVGEALRQNPSLQANAAQILVEPGLGMARYTAAARSFDHLGWFIGTSGAGLLYLPEGAGLPDRVRFGLPSSAVGAVCGWTQGVWAATDRTNLTPAALTLVDDELRGFRSLQGLPGAGMPFTQVRRLVGQGKSLWAATDYGLARVGTADGAVELVDASRGLPDSRVYVVAARQGRVTAGTRRGVVRVDDKLQVERVAPHFVDPTLAVFPVGDSVWIGTQRGVLLLLPGQDDAVRPAALGTPSLQAPVVALASLGDTVVALTRDQLLWRDPRSGAWTLGPNLSAVLGALTAFVPDGPGFWIAGDLGVGFASLATPAIRPLLRGDLPGAARDLAVNGGYLWIATDAGLARFRLDAIRP